MEREKPDKNGCYRAQEVVDIPIAKSARARFSIRIALCADGRFRTGYDYYIEGSGLGCGGGSSGIRHKGAAFDSRRAAVLIIAEGFLDKMESSRLDPVRKRKIEMALAGFIKTQQAPDENELCGKVDCAYRAQCMEQPVSADAMCLAEVAARRAAKPKTKKEKYRDGLEQLTLF